jgi:DNA polymerase/3'-5' exonuclease PolX
MQNLVERHFPGETTLPTLSRVPGHVALAIGERLEKELRPLCTRLSIAGSLRRDRARIRKGEPLSTKDIDLVASPKPGVSVQEVLEKFQSLSLQNRGGHSSARIFLNGLKAELDVVPPEHFEPMLMTATGNKTENLKLRVAAKKLGLSLTEKGLRDSKGQILVTKPKDIYRALGRPYKAPSERSKQRREA